MAFLKENVFRLDVAMDDLLSVREVECAGDLLGDPQRVLDWQNLFAIDPVAKRFALDERHHVVELAVGVARVEQLEDVRVAETRRNLNLATEPIGAERHADIVVQNLDGNLAAVRYVARQEDSGHASLSELALDVVAILESGLQMFEKIGQA